MSCLKQQVSSGSGIRHNCLSPLSNNPNHSLAYSHVSTLSQFFLFQKFFEPHNTVSQHTFSQESFQSHNTIDNLPSFEDHFAHTIALHLLPSFRDVLTNHTPLTPITPRYSSNIQAPQQIFTYDHYFTHKPINHGELPRITL